jgi:predicted ATP-dependent endonuclease of OLD family
VILKSFRVTDYKSVTDSTPVAVDAHVTALVGKNESGKTAALQALYRLNPLSTGHQEDFEPLYDFPRSRWAAEKGSAAEKTPIEATFELSDDEMQAVQAAVGDGVLKSKEFTVERKYGGGTLWTFALNERARIDALIEEHGAKPGVADGAETIPQLRGKLKAQAQKAAPTQQLFEAIEKMEVWREVWNVVHKTMPQFLYFDEYSVLPGTINIAEIRDADPSSLDAPLRTALSLLRLAGTKPGEFTEEDYEARRAELEAASSAITREVFEYWSQNKDLRVFFDVDFKLREGQPRTREPQLKIRIDNSRHHVTLDFDERSAGFVWFFSFLAAFSEYRDSDQPLILLLDEPGLGLHASAQGDLLRYIDEKLAPARQVIYSTHSPFMIDPTALERSRTVEDTLEEGTKISDDVLSSSSETLYPLQAALGYDLAQSLFVAPDNLVVEGPSDLVYLTAASDRLRELDRVHLDPRWVIVPVGGVDKIPTFLALLNAHLNVAAVIDGKAGGNQRINSLINKGVIEQNKVLPLAQVLGTAEADIEDFFNEDFYLQLLNESGVAKVDKGDLDSGSRLVRRIEDHLGQAYSHYAPARYLLGKESLIQGLDDATLDRFEKLFGQINGLLS